MPRHRLCKFPVSLYMILQCRLAFLLFFRCPVHRLCPLRRCLHRHGILWRLTRRHCVFRHPPREYFLSAGLRCLQLFFRGSFRVGTVPGLFQIDDRDVRICADRCMSRHRFCKFPVFLYMILQCGFAFLLPLRCPVHCLCILRRCLRRHGILWHLTCGRRVFRHPPRGCFLSAGLRCLRLFFRGSFRVRTVPGLFQIDDRDVCICADRYFFRPVCMLSF